MAFKKCEFCRENKVPIGGQCNKCGFIDGLRRMPTSAEFKTARKINEEHNYAPYESIDMLLLD
ncbi:hypothetical protein HYW21_02380 [Candidatus Woesearchaeota archaeon]|nr:hypothetical protein [Candidatus Woesearchaeota archaeon]